MRIRSLVIAFALVSSLPLVARAATSPLSCERTVAKRLQTCFASVSPEVRRCYLESGAACAASDAKISTALDKLRTSVLQACPDAATVEAAGYGAAMTPAGLADRVAEACQGDPATLAARTFGGPQAAILASADAQVRACLDRADDAAATAIRKTVAAQASCIAKAHRGRPCDTTRTSARIGLATAKAVVDIDARCSDLKSTLGMDTQTYVDRAAAQAGCLTAAAHADGGPLSLECGARPEVTVPARGQWVQVTLPEAIWGTRCGDGSPYSFWMRLAPAASPAEKVLVDLQGGGVCIFESDCTNVKNNSPGLFRSDDEGQPNGGTMSDDPALNPFADWTRVFLPYCTQDVHIGGGLQSVFSPTLTVNRFGAINARAALRYLRDVLWQELGATEADGYRPDRLTVIFSGESAGAFGVQYNYHYVLDDLRWAHTTAVPDAGMALDNGGAVGVKALGAIISTENNPFGWGTLPYQPTYCQDTDCAVGPILQQATTVRLKAVPEQQILNVTNQVDQTQISTTFFPSAVSWINALRTSYCENQGLNGIRYWMPAQSAPYHTILRTPSRFNSVTAGGVTVAQFLADAMASPDTVVDHVDEGTLVTDYPGVNPIACLGP